MPITGPRISGVMYWDNDMPRLMLLLLGLLSSFGLRADMASVQPLPKNPAEMLRLPAGFKAQVFARLDPSLGGYFRGPRMMAFGPDGHLYLSLGMDNKVVMLPDKDKNGQADAVVTVADNLDAPQGLLFLEDRLLVAEQGGVVAFEQKSGQWTNKTPLIRDLPTGGHTMKTLKQGPDGYLYLNAGSSCNVCDEQNPLRATLLRYSPDGRPAGSLLSLGRHATSPTWAFGLRNAQGFAWHPVTQEMYATNNGSDMRGASKNGPVDDDLPPEHMNRLVPGAHYGWPHCWGERVTDPKFPGADGFCAGTTPPVITFPAHSTPIGISFLDKSAFPAEYRDDALVALHGSWNRQQPSGYKIVRVHFKNNVPESVSDFATGWLDGKAAWGRPVDILTGPEGALYVSDDRAGLVYRIVYEGLGK